MADGSENGIPQGDLLVPVAVGLGAAVDAAFLPIEERLVLTEHALQGFVDDPIAGALDELAIKFEIGND